MKAVIQRVSEANVVVDEKVISAISRGYLILLGIEEADEISDIEWLANKIISLRIFNDENGQMNRSIQDIDGNILVVSQFTLYASTKKGNRPSFIKAAKPEKAISVYEKFIIQLESLFNKKIGTGLFGADMKVSILNDGPVTIIIDTKNKE